MSELIGIVVVVAWLLSAGVGAIIGAQDGKAGKGALLGLFFGPAGWVMMMCDIGFFGLGVTVVIILGTAFFGISAALREDKEIRARTERDRNAESAAHDQRMKEIKEETQTALQRRDREEAQRIAEGEGARQQRMWERLPKWDRYGKPINRVTPIEIAEQSGVSALIPVRPTPDPRAAAAEIERKYGTKAAR